MGMFSKKTGTDDARKEESTNGSSAGTASSVVARPPAVPTPPPAAMDDAGGRADAEIADELARLTASVDALRDRAEHADRRIEEIEEQMSRVAGLAETLSSHYSPFTDADAPPSTASRSLRPDDPRAAEAVASAPEPGVPPQRATATDAPLVDAFPPTALMDLLLTEWSRVLVNEAGPERARDVVRDAVALGWLGERAADTLERFVNVRARGRTGTPEARVDAGTALWWSRLFLSRVPGVDGDRGEG